MANKRELKKAICNACGDVAGQCLLAQWEMADKEAEWDNIIVNAALLQREGIKRVCNAKFDKKPSEFANLKEYRAASRAFYAQAEKDLSEYMREQIGKLVEAMNALLPKKK